MKLTTQSNKKYSLAINKLLCSHQLIIQSPPPNLLIPDPEHLSGFFFLGFTLTMPIPYSWKLWELPYNSCQKKTPLLIPMGLHKGQKMSLKEPYFQNRPLKIPLQLYQTWGNKQIFCCTCKWSFNNNISWTLKKKTSVQIWCLISFFVFLLMVGMHLSLLL